jgi:hypothetical protein
MPVRKLIESASFAPEALEVIYAAFDAAWEEIAPRVGNDPTAIEFARNRLAQAVLGAAEAAEGSDPVRIKADAVETFLSSLPAKS